MNFIIKLLVIIVLLPAAAFAVIYGLFILLVIAGALAR